MVPGNGVDIDRKNYESVSVSTFAREHVSYAWNIRIFAHLFPFGSITDGEFNRRKLESDACELRASSRVKNITRIFVNIERVIKVRQRRLTIADGSDGSFQLHRSARMYSRSRGKDPSNNTYSRGERCLLIGQLSLRLILASELKKYLRRVACTRSRDQIESLDIPVNDSSRDEHLCVRALQYNVHRDAHRTHAQYTSYCRDEIIHRTHARARGGGEKTRPPRA